MKLSLLFFFAITTPFVIFITEILYGGTSPDTLKNNLNQTNIYQDVSKFIINSKPEGPQAPKSSEISLLIYNRFTPEYIQTKTEKLIDDSNVWITKNGPSPVISFVDIKEDMINSNPEFQMVLKDLPKEFTEENIKEYSGEESLSQYAVDPQEIQADNSLIALAQNDFVVPVGEYFGGLKTFYEVMRIAHPILIVILLATLFIIWKLGENLPSKLRWIGATVITTGIFGIGMIFFNTLAISHLSEVTMSTSDNFIAAFSPIMLQLMDVFMKQYGQFQLATSITMFTIGAACLIAARLVKQPLGKMQILKPVKK